MILPDGRCYTLQSGKWLRPLDPRALSRKRGPSAKGIGTSPQGPLCQKTTRIPEREPLREDCAIVRTRAQKGSRAIPHKGEACGNMAHSRASRAPCARKYTRCLYGVFKSIFQEVLWQSGIEVFL